MKNKNIAFTAHFVIKQSKTLGNDDTIYYTKMPCETKPGTKITTFVRGEIIINMQKYLAEKYDAEVRLISKKTYEENAKEE